MHKKIFWILILFITAIATPQIIPAQNSDDLEDTRSYFLHTRRKANSNQVSQPNKFRPPHKPSGSSVSSSGSKPSNTSGSVPFQNSQKELIGIGYTFYKSDNSGKPIRVKSDSIFHAGDTLRIVLEPNIDGYLYVFHNEADGKPEMLFPDARLTAGSNRINAHVPYEVPSTKEKDPRFRWFYFDNKPTIERLYIVVTKNPLPGVPIGNELVAYCQTYSGGCPWKPTTDIWGTIRSAVNTPARISLKETIGAAQNEEEQEAIERGIGLPSNAPEPSVVRLNLSGASVLVAVLELIHR
jgi:hypothetical protein